MKKGITVVFIVLVIVFGYITVHALTAPVKLSAAQLGGELIHSHKPGIDCFACHTIDGKGGNVGPNLSKEGLAKHSIHWIEVQIATPGKHFKSGSMVKINGKTFMAIMPDHKMLNKKELFELASYLDSLK
ncbi:MAG: cytochrome c [Candidatus Acididesulfobacter guangdongensis]|jgi:mono/diheme cytochrome c family protein|uniref:Cytochrome c n=1 Tax=Acididesulfobacter guangdongensis TaxID=2597225 RepID=A0A519BHG6_ACIG2|nr:MAG: cytochrome c [Candidatus Acididesulfobacter guangdongensis]